MKARLTCLRHQARPLVILWMATWRLFISPSSSGADRLSELKLLRSSARKRLRSWRHCGGGAEGGEGKGWRRQRRRGIEEEDNIKR